MNFTLHLDCNRAEVIIFIISRMENQFPAKNTNHLHSLHSSSSSTFAPAKKITVENLKWKGQVMPENISLRIKHVINK